MAHDIQKNTYGYTESIGELSLRKAISKHYKLRYDVMIPYTSIAITSGASAGIFLSLLTLFDAGETIGVMSPGYPCYKNIINALGLKIFIINTTIKNNFQLTPEIVKNIPSYVKGLIVESPSNPCGSIISNDDLYKISKICKERKIKVVSDEIYHDINYENTRPKTFYAFNNDAVVINSFSKYFLMTGFRLGWIIANNNIIDRIKNLSMNFYLSPSSFSQAVAKETFNYYKYFDAVIKKYQTNRDFLITALNKIGLTKYVFPKAAFYLYIDISDFHNESYLFCKKMIEDIGITAAPGRDFDVKNGKKFVRISYACNIEELKIAVELIKKWI